MVIFNLLAFAGLMSWGRRWDRAAVGLLMLSIVADPIVAQLEIGTWRAGIAASNVTLLITLWWVAHKADRWWLIVAAGIQLIIVTSHILPVLLADHSVWSGFALRRTLWILMTVVFFIGAFEAWIRRRPVQS